MEDEHPTIQFQTIERTMIDAEPTIDNSNIQGICEYAKNWFEPTATEVDTDEGAYFYLLRDSIEYLGGVVLAMITRRLRDIGYTWSN